MRLIAFLVFLTTTICIGQSAEVYDWNYVMKTVRKNKMNITAATKEIILEISNTYNGEKEQRELIKAYKGIHDFKVVDKVILKKLIDSLVQDGINEDIKALAFETRTSIEFRLLGKKIDDFSFPDKDGKPVGLTSLRNRIVIIELWATWCGPCVKEMPRIPSLRKANPAIEFYSISLDKSLDKMKRFVDKNEYDWPIVFGGDETLNEELWKYFNIVAIPKYYTVDREGIIINIVDKLDDSYIRSLK